MSCNLWREAVFNFIDAGSIQCAVTILMAVGQQKQALELLGDSVGTKKLKPSDAVEYIFTNENLMQVPNNDPGIKSAVEDCMGELLKAKDKTEVVSASKLEKLMNKHLPVDSQIFSLAKSNQWARLLGCDVATAKLNGRAEHIGMILKRNEPLQAAKFFRHIGDHRTTMECAIMFSDAGSIFTTLRLKKQAELKYLKLFRRSEGNELQKLLLFAIDLDGKQGLFGNFVDPSQRLVFVRGVCLFFVLDGYISRASQDTLSLSTEVVSKLLQRAQRIAQDCDQSGSCFPELSCLWTLRLQRDKSMTDNQKFYIIQSLVTGFSRMFKKLGGGRGRFRFHQREVLEYFWCA